MLRGSDDNLVILQELFGFWADRIRQAKGNYLCYDCETTGLSKKEDLIWQLGQCFASHGYINGYRQYCLNWFDCAAINPHWLNGRIEEHKKHMREAGKETGCSARKLRNGMRPEVVLRSFMDTFDGVQKLKGLIVGHNIVRYDNIMFANNVQRCLNVDYRFQEDCVLDTGAFVKAYQIGELPKAGESLLGFCSRILNNTYAPGVYYSLDTFCLEHFKLQELFGVNKARMHSAGYDAMVTQLLFQELLRESRILCE